MAEKTYAVRILDPAQGELEEIAQLYLSLSGVQSARKITDKIYEALDHLTGFPLSGPSMRETELRNLGYRFLVAEKYIIIYRLIGDRFMCITSLTGVQTIPHFSGLNYSSNREVN